MLGIFAEKCCASGEAVAKIDLLGLTSREFYWQLGTALRTAVRINDDVVRLFRQVNDHLQACCLQGKVNAPPTR